MEDSPCWLPGVVAQVPLPGLLFQQVSRALPLQTSQGQGGPESWRRCCAVWAQATRWPPLTSVCPSVKWDRGYSVPRAERGWGRDGPPAG